MQARLWQTRRRSGASGGRRSFAVASLAAMCAALYAEVSHSAAWVQEQGAGQAIVTGIYARADKAFSDDGSQTGAVDFQKGAVSLLIDYGVLSWLTVSGTAEFGSDTSERLPFRRPGLSNAALSVRAQVYRSDRYAMSVEIGGRTEDAYGEADRLVDTFGWDSPLLEARWSGGANFELFGRASFADVSAGYRYRTGEGPDEVLLDATLGVRAFDPVTLLFQSFTTVADGDIAAISVRQKAQASVVYDLSEAWSLQTGGFATVAGQNVLAERGAFAALWYRF
ncbi:hypothetical protein U0C82_14925 [Fulvimarina sp. 2208YS6-2-32]|uniref:Uncharacterized protein n=1 Tax=Fulvimarina uroteuthidis TaxID=3098149 RepID=A0ABU5I696_9HYPH|nr:hypothetical protein [Fulvimarina sp. 2208YS6-2-32]MDY8110433.1 hypothetical protein [Fulvimarina sp. 2208YS6-2-32]